MQVNKSKTSVSSQEIVDPGVSKMKLENGSSGNLSQTADVK